MTITKTNTIAEVLRTDRGTAKIFMEHGMHCLACPHATRETLAQACAAHGQDADQLVERLNEYLAQSK
ncbi:MAG TPA: DUF1858 domain-containing protein [Clostridiales bacterium]|jgi:hybrid cluster-associated redox disulfide protein|nr:DUF1858 domain-containing protein [Clostridiales bacterium]